MKNIHATSLKGKSSYAIQSHNPERVGTLVGLITTLIHRHFSTAMKVEYAMGNMKEIETMFKNLARNWFDLEDSGKLHLFLLKRFFHEVFNLKIDLKPKLISIPDFDCYMYIPVMISSRELIERAKKLFPVDIPFNESSIIWAMKSRYNHGYLFSHRGFIEHDKEYTGVSYEDVKHINHHTFMNSYEYLYCTMFKYWLTGNMYDVKGITITSSTHGENSEYAVTTQTHMRNLVFNSQYKSIKGDTPPAGLREIKILLM